MFISLFMMCLIVHKIGPVVGRGRPGPGTGLASGGFGRRAGSVCFVLGRRAPGVVPGGRPGFRGPRRVQSLIRCTSISILFHHVINVIS